jgi:mono/diheme cytochrome c family protein
VAAVLLIGLVVAACDSTATYPIDFFSEMHYQKSWHSQEPPRPDAPASIVPITGGAVPNYTMDEAKALTNSVPVNAQSRQLGQQLFAVNCQVCHGPNGDGNGKVAGYFRAGKAPPPANLHRPDIKAMTDGQLFWVITNGFGAYMPPFGNLITPEQRWALVIHIRQLQGS